MQHEGFFCQSCAMPLNKSECCGTEKNNSKNKKYCVYCYKDGKFTLPNCSMEEMVEISAKGWSNQNPNISYPQAKDFLKKCLPNLERWNK